MLRDAIMWNPRFESSSSSTAHSPVGKRDPERQGDDKTSKMLRKLMLTMALAGLGLEGAPAAVAAPPPSIVSAVVSAVVDPYLAAQLTEAGPTDRLLVFVHGRTAQEARTAVAAAGLERPTRCLRIPTSWRMTCFTEPVTSGAT